VLKEFLPTLSQIANILKKDLGLEVDDDYQVYINPIQIIVDFSDFDEYGIYTFTAPFNIYEWIPPFIFAEMSNNITAYIPENRYINKETFEMYNGSLFTYTGI